MLFSSLVQQMMYVHISCMFTDLMGPFLYHNNRRDLCGECLKPWELKMQMMSKNSINHFSQRIEPFPTNMYNFTWLPCEESKEKAAFLLIGSELWFLIIYTKSHLQVWCTVCNSNSHILTPHPWTHSDVISIPTSCRAGTELQTMMATEWSGRGHLCSCMSSFLVKSFSIQEVGSQCSRKFGWMHVAIHMFQDVAYLGFLWGWHIWVKPKLAKTVNDWHNKRISLTPQPEMPRHKGRWHLPKGCL